MYNICCIFIFVEKTIDTDDAHARDFFSMMNKIGTYLSSFIASTDASIQTLSDIQYKDPLIRCILQFCNYVSSV